MKDVTRTVDVALAVPRLAGDALICMKGCVVRIDHVMLVTLDPEREMARLRELGFGTDAGGAFAGGVQNWAVPMASGQYLELLTVDDDAEGDGANWIRKHVEAGQRFAGWGVEVSSVDDVAERLGLPVEPGALLDGNSEPRWRNVACPRDQSFLPFFITYDWTNDVDEDGEQAGWRRRWVEQARHDTTPLEISGLELVGDPNALHSWLGEGLPVSVAPGAPARLVAVHIRTELGEVVVHDL